MKAKNAFLIILALLLSSCAVVGGRTTISRDKDLDFKVTEKLHPGMSIPEIVQLMGRPTSYGKDELGREYLKYTVQQVSSAAGSIFVGVAGGVKSSNEIKGFEVLVQVSEGKLVTYGWTMYAND